LCHDLLDSQRTLQTQLEALDLAHTGNQNSAEATINGTVTVGSARDKKHIVLDVGSTDGVRDGMQFHVYRGSTYKGRVRANVTAPDTCVCTIEQLVNGQTLESGDRVTTRL
jgi:cell shape-determining protein MreC